MKTISMKIMALGVAALTFASCNLDLYPLGSIVNDESVPAFQSKDDIESFRVGVYSTFRGLANLGVVSEEVMFNSFNASVGYGNNYGAIHRLDNDFTSSDENVESVWGNNYLAIRIFNQVIEEQEKVEDESLKQAALEARGDALFARAYAYLSLARHFGKDYDPATAATDLCVPLVTRFNLNEKPARATVAQVYEQIGKDLAEAMEIISEYGPQPEQASNNFTVDAVTALYARYYLDIHDYKNAAECAKSLVDGGVYALADSEASFKKIYEEDETTEAILQMYADTAGETPGGISSFTSYVKNDNSKTGYAFRPLYVPSKVMISRYEVTDLRFRNWLLVTNKDPFDNGTSLSNGITVFIKTWGAAKYNTSGIRSGQLAFAPFKISEMYLIAAEASLLDNNQADADKYLKELQTARLGKKNKNATMENIQTEWLRETIAEGLTLSNYKRWGIGFNGREAQDIALSQELVMTGANFDQKVLSANDHRLTWPIPRYERQVNPNLVQNDGYGAN